MNFKFYNNRKSLASLLAAICVASVAVAKPSAGSASDRGFLEEYEVLEKQFQEQRNSKRAGQQNGVENRKPLRSIARDVLPGFAKGSDRLEAAFDVHFSTLVSPDASFHEKGTLLGSLRHGALTEEQCDGLLYFIQLDQLRENGKESTRFLSLKNDALECLIELPSSPVGLTSAMITMVRDESKDLIWREYVLQHFVMLYRAKWPVGTVANKEGRRERQAIQRALAASMFHCDSGLAGTGLIVVEDLSRDYPEFENVLERSAKMIARDENACASSRITALSMIQDTADEEMVTLACELASNDQQSLAIRIAAAGRLREWSSDSAQAHAELQKMKRGEQHKSKQARMLNLVAEQKTLNRQFAK